jgi:nucleoside-diphosphate-sugar epimerase
VSEKRVLLTGARGFIGRQVAPLLLERGYEVHAVTSGEAPAESRSARWHRADLLDAAQISALLEASRPSHLLHLAWTTAPGEYWTSPNNHRWLAAGVALIRAFAAQGGRRAVGAGTCAEYDWSSGHCDETATPLLPATLYGQAKRALSYVFDDAQRGGRMTAAWGRIFLLYGPAEHPARLVPSVVRALLRGRPASCSEGSQLRDFLYVKDVAGAFAALLDSEVTGAVNIASGEPTTVKDVVLAIADAIGRPDLVRFGDPANEPSRLTAATARLFGEVGWRPRYDLQSGLAETLAWWRDQFGLLQR